MHSFNLLKIHNESSKVPGSHYWVFNEHLVFVTGIVETRKTMSLLWWSLLSMKDSQSVKKQIRKIPWSTKFHAENLQRELWKGASRRLDWDIRGGHICYLNAENIRAKALRLRWAWTIIQAKRRSLELRLHSMRLEGKAGVTFCRTLEVRLKGLGFIVSVICGRCAERHLR